ncbi:MAG: PTS sugar transporter subunit IIA [Candidatus Omnitrophica bacterium]|nr:PTS sugar transporter subunit IIA [Candidatus Omnitrophota bacterium]
MKNTRILTTQELAVYMKLNEKTILKMAQNKDIPGIKVGSQWRFHLESIDKYLQKDFMHIPESELDNIIKTTDHVIPLSRLFDESIIDLDLKAETKQDVLVQLCGLAYNAGIVADKKKLCLKLNNREKMLSTAVGNGIAIPHPRHPDNTLFKKPNILMARSNKGVDFNSPDDKKVHLFFMTCAPNMVIHLRLLAKISKLLHIKGVINKFMRLSSGKEIIQFLLEMERKHLFSWKTNDKEFANDQLQ